VAGRPAWRRGRAGGRPHELLPEVLERVESIEAQLSAIGQRLGAGPEVGDLEQQIAQARRGKQAAAGEEDYESAAAARDGERQLLADKAARQQEWAAAIWTLPPWPKSCTGSAGTSGGSGTSSASRASDGRTAPPDHPFPGPSADGDP
jgi:hypothetical protein